MSWLLTHNHSKLKLKLAELIEAAFVKEGIVMSVNINTLRTNRDSRATTDIASWEGRSSGDKYHFHSWMTMKSLVKQGHVALLMRGAPYNIEIC